MRSKILFLGLSSVVALSTVFACTSTIETTTPTGTPEGGGGSKEGGGDGGGGGKDSSTPIEEDSSTSNDPDQAGAAEATLQGCATCCGPTNHPAGYKVFVDSLTECACTGTGSDGGAPCATQCSTGLCATPPAQPNATCNTCLQGSINNGACAEHLSTKCGASADCMAQQKCVGKCQGKP